MPLRYSWSDDRVIDTSIISTVEQLLAFCEAERRSAENTSTEPPRTPQRASQGYDDGYTPTPTQHRDTSPIEEDAERQISSQLSWRGSYRAPSTPTRKLQTDRTASFNMPSPASRSSPRTSQCFSSSGFSIDWNIRRDFSHQDNEYYQDSQALLSHTSSFYSQASSALEPEYHLRRPTLINKLSADIISRIFKFYVESDTDESALRLGSISRNWRQIAWKTPSLWTRLTVYAHSKNQDLLREMVAQWLERSDKHMFHFGLYHKDDREDDNQLSAVQRVGLFNPIPIFHLLKKHSRRCVSLSIEGPNILFSLFWQANIFLPELKNLTIERSPTDQHITSGRSYNLTPNLTESLKTLQICGLDTDKLYLSPAVNFSNLTEVITRTMDISLALEILKRATSLQKLRISYLLRSEKSLDEVLSNFPERITCPALTTLDVLGIDEPDKQIYAFFFDRIDLPNLTTLSCKHWVTAECLEMLRRSGCSLQSLYLRKFVASTDKFIDCLSVLPTLISLHISLSDGDPRQDRLPATENDIEYAEFDLKLREEWRVILAALACGTIPRSESGMADTHRAEPLYLPLLQTVDIHGQADSQFPWKLLCRFLDSRGPPPYDPSTYFHPGECIPSLKHRTLKYFRWTMTGLGQSHYHIKDSVVANLQGLAVEGITIDVIHTGRHVRLKSSEARRLGNFTEVRTTSLISGVSVEMPTDLVREDDIDLLKRPNQSDKNRVIGR
ncbi:hypothetical protein CVT25_009649 [Psilocybe cyanescens]|uniref:F-box domain-containing protein n=1 Tax=Psilocybe cyanescens TaxID=93625 RepID=A0A409XGY9_PSICY|nr:hypothetical protein CVT25_009649 [Psilocybe cyanescens]